MSVDVPHVQAFPSPDREPIVDEPHYTQIFERLQLENGYKETEFMKNMLSLGMQGDDDYFDNQINQYIRYYQMSLAAPEHPGYSHDADLNEFRGVMFALAGAYYSRAQHEQSVLGRKKRLSQSLDMLKKAATDMQRAGEPTNTGDISTVGSMLEGSLNFRPTTFHRSMFQKSTGPDLATIAFGDFRPEDAH